MVLKQTIGRGEREGASGLRAALSPWLLPRLAVPSFRTWFAVSFRMVCRDFMLPEICKPCLFLCLFQFAQLIGPVDKIVPGASMWYNNRKEG